MILNPNFDPRSVKQALKEKLDTVSPPGIHVDQLPTWLNSHLRIKISSPQVEILLYELLREGQVGKSVTNPDGSCRWWSKASSDLLDQCEDLAPDEILSRLVAIGSISPNTARRLSQAPRYEDPKNRPPPPPKPPILTKPLSELRLKVEGAIAVVTGRDLKVHFLPEKRES